MELRHHRTTIDIDLDAYEQARQALGTEGFKETVNASLRRAGQEAALGRAADRILTGRFSAPTPVKLEQGRAALAVASGLSKFRVKSVVPRYLADSTIWAWAARNASTRAKLSERVARGEIATCVPVRSKCSCPKRPRLRRTSSPRSSRRSWLPLRRPRRSEPSNFEEPRSDDPRRPPLAGRR